MIAVVDTSAGSAYPSGRTARDRFVLARRDTRPVLDPRQPPDVLVEPERTAEGGLAATATVFLTGRECPWRCVMCDLWRHTLVADTPRGAIARQVADAVQRLLRLPAMPSVVKLYNAGSFFDRRAVPPDDDVAIAEAVQPFTRVVVESHPALVGDRTWRLRDRLTAARPGARLEVAMGLETAHPSALEQLNKGITVDSFAAAARSLSSHGVDLRVFLLIHPPFVPADEQAAWLARSVDVAFDNGASVVSLIPTRGGNGAMEALAAMKHFVAPSLTEIERAAAIGLARAALRTGADGHPEQAGRKLANQVPRPSRGRTFVDTWDLPRFASCSHCAQARQARLTQLNLDQRVPPPVACGSCGQVTPS